MARILLFTGVLGVFSFVFGSAQVETCAPVSDTTLRGTFVNGVPFFYRLESAEPITEPVARMLEFLPNLEAKTLAGLRRILTAEEFGTLPPGQQARLTEADEEVRAAEGESADTAYEYLEWLEQALSPGAAVEILTGDADLINFLRGGLSRAELARLPADVREALCGAG